jgi:4-amino-4-deoxy-L-arabinose transferase-like glycosyltransferase
MHDGMTYDTDQFYKMAQVIVNGATPYVDFQDPKPPLIYFTLTLPLMLGQKLLGGMLLVGICNLVSAALVMKIGWKLYGRFAGLVAGLLFLLNIGWAQGYFIMTEPFTVLFLLIATYFTLFSTKKHYFIAGLSLGVAIGFKQYALIALPLLLLALYLKKELKHVPILLAGVALPLIAIFGAILLTYGEQAMNAAIYWSFGVAGSYIGEADTDGVTNYQSEPLMLLPSLAMAASMFTSLIFFAFAGVFKNHDLKTEEVYFLLAGVCFALTILIRQYLHYWVLALPFFALLCARNFSREH